MQDQSTTTSVTTMVRCWRCDARVVDIFHFYGRFTVSCRKCKALVVWTGVTLDSAQSNHLTTRNDRHRVSLPAIYQCPLCHRHPISAPAFRGRIDRLCNPCRQIYSIRRNDSDAEIMEWLNRSAQVRRAVMYDDPNLVSAPPRLSRPSPEEMFAVLEERWQAFSSQKLRERGRVAVGLRFDVFNRDGFRCRYCGRSIDDGIILHADHVIPESKGGPTVLENLVTACSDCNLGKSNKGLLA